MTEDVRLSFTLLDTDGIGTKEPIRLTLTPKLDLPPDVKAVFYGIGEAITPDARLPIRGDIWPKSDGSWDWQFLFAGTYTMPPGNRRLDSTFFVRYDYFNDSVADWVKDKAGWAVA